MQTKLEVKFELLRAAVQATGLSPVATVREFFAV